jgi:hypothetical protein
MIGTKNKKITRTVTRLACCWPLWKIAENNQQRAAAIENVCKWHSEV